MKFDPAIIIVLVAMLLAIGGMLKPIWPITAVAVFLACVAFLVKFAAS